MNIRNLQKFLFVPLLFTVLSAWSQNTIVHGSVVDSTDRTPVVGVTVTAQGTSVMTQTDARGNFDLNVPSGVNNLIFSYVGYLSKTVSVTATSSNGNMNILMQPTSSSLNEVVVVGYGTEKRKDLTGSIATVNSKDFNTGEITTPDQLITGKVAGVVVTSNSGEPGSGSTIRIRGEGSLSASNDPLIVIDGVPVDDDGISGAASPLDLVNPADIASFTILKDASAAAIYGNRASNGVIIITTKKGTANSKFQVNFNTVNSESIKMNEVPVLNAKQFRQIVNKNGDAEQISLLNHDTTVNTNWQNEIYQPAFGTDDNIAFSGGLKELPYRLSLEYDDQAGLLKTNTFDRSSVSLNLDPTLLNGNLHMDINFKGSINDNRFANGGAIGQAVSMAPTAPVYAQNNLGGYYQWTDSAGAPIQLATGNPLATLEQYSSTSTVKRSIGNIDLNYRMPFLPALSADLNTGYDVSSGSGKVYVPTDAAQDYAAGGYSNQYSESKKDGVFDFYLNYVKDFEKIQSRLDLTAGYSFQDFTENTPASPTKNDAGTILNAGTADSLKNTLLSYYARMNYSFKDRYILSASIRYDGSSRFAPADRWGTFPSIAAAWRINQESFLKNSKTISNLKLRIGYGATGNQDINNDYAYLPVYIQSSSVAQYEFGNTFVNTYRANPYDPNIKWETESSFNVGLDYGFFNDRITGYIEVYNKLTSNLLALIPTPEGANLSNQLLTNVGNMDNKGFEFQIDAYPVKNRVLTWDIGFNFTYNKNEITKLTQLATDTSAGILTGGISGGTGNSVQIQSVGYPENTFYVYKQVYGKNGVPIEGVYSDVNNNPSNLFYRDESPFAPWTLGFSTELNYKNWDFGFSMHGSIGNYNYDNVEAGGTLNGVLNPDGFLGNINKSYLQTGFVNSEYFSDNYVQNASFLRMDNISLGYNFGKVFSKQVNLRLNAIVQNVFVITKYPGLDPEVFGGIDNNLYPRPRIYSLGLNASF